MVTGRIAWVTGALPLVLLAGSVFPTGASASDTFASDRCEVTNRRGAHGTQRINRRNPELARTHRLECGCVERLVRGHYEIQRETVQDPGCYRDEWVEPTFRICRVGGVEVRIQLSAGYYRKVWVPGRIRHVERRVWIPDHYVRERDCREHRGHGRHRTSRHS